MTLPVVNLDGVLRYIRGATDAGDVLAGREFEKLFGLRKPFGEYSPGRQRFYLRAFKRGDYTPNKTEYEQRKKRKQIKLGKTTPSKTLYDEFKAVREALREDSSREDYDRLVDLFGEGVIREDLRTQRVAGNDYVDGKPETGNARFYNQSRRQWLYESAAIRGKWFPIITAMNYYHFSRKV